MDNLETSFLGLKIEAEGPSKEIKIALKEYKGIKTLQEIADMCKVNRSIVKDISQNSTWKHI